MAEVAIPMAFRINVYINKSKEPEPVLEGFEETTLPNTKRPPVNYPVENLKELKNNVSKYNGKKTGVENFYKGDNYSEARQRSANNTGFKSLNGEIVSTGDLEHNNMVPFFGSNVSQPSLDSGNSRLNLYTGSGQEQIRKQEQSSLFKPQKNMSHVFGAPNTNNFVQERMQLNITDKQNNVKPWKEIRVGPGLNKGFSSEEVVDSIPKWKLEKECCQKM